MLRPAGRDKPAEPRFVSRPKTSVLTLEAVEERLGPERRRKQGLSKRAKRLVNESAEESAEQWLKVRGAVAAGGAFSVAQRRKLRRFFDELDEDGSGHISVEELLGPLLAFGLASSEGDVSAFVDEVDEDASGQICYPEFVRALQAAEKKRAAARAAARAAGPRRPVVKLRSDPAGGLHATRSLPALQVVQRGEGGALLHGDPRFKKRQMSMAAMGIARRRHKERRHDAHPLEQLQAAGDGALELDTLISLRRRERLMATIESSLPTTGDLEGIRWEEQRLRQRLFAGGHHDEGAAGAAARAAETEKLAALQEQRRALLDVAGETRLLMAALEKAVRFDQGMERLREQPARARDANRHNSVQLAPLAKADFSREVLATGEAAVQWREPAAAARAPRPGHLADDDFAATSSFLRRHGVHTPAAEPARRPSPLRRYMSSTEIDRLLEPGLGPNDDIAAAARADRTDSRVMRRASRLFPAEDAGG